jgi:hypothetical protein
MRVFFGATTAKLNQSIKYYNAIRKILIDMGCIIEFDWLPEAIAYKKKNPTGKRNIKKIFAANLIAMNRADIAIVEYTIPNFSSSHQITYSIFRQKPTLVLRLKKDNSFSDSYIEALESPFIAIKDYNLKNLRAILEQFVGVNKLEKGLSRYNIMLDKKQKYYLDWAHLKYKKSRSEILRDALQFKIEGDSEYREYLK